MRSHKTPVHWPRFEATGSKTSWVEEVVCWTSLDAARENADPRSFLLLGPRVRSPATRGTRRETLEVDLDLDLEGTLLCLASVPPHPMRAGLALVAPADIGLDTFLDVFLLPHEAACLVRCERNDTDDDVDRAPRGRRSE